MAAVAPTGNGPFEFTDSNGKQISIPLTAFSFDALGKLSVDTKWTSIASAAPAKALLDYMTRQGLIAPAPVPSPKPAAIVKAAFPGPVGNNIAVSVSITTPSPDPTKTTFEIDVTEQEKYTGLTPTTLVGLLGTAKIPGSLPGLVVVDGSVTGVPAALPQTGLTGGTDTANANSGSQITTFKLDARAPGTAGNSIAITIDNVTATAFDLTVALTLTSSNLTIATVQSALAKDLGYEIVALPPSGGVFSVPAAGTTNLSGGGGATSASAILVAD